MIKATCFTLLFFILLCQNVMASTDVAKVIIIRGNVKAKQDGKVVSLKKGIWIKEGAIIQTANKSFVKLLFIDKSSMNLGPKSKMVVNKFPRKKAGIITLMKGQLRSKVTKNYMNIKNKKQSKLFIKTKTAAMGVRGTDFRVDFNPVNNNTGLITFSGAVAMAQIHNARDFRPSQSNLEKVVSGPESVIVKKGQFSQVSPSQASKALSPVKINPAQLETLKKNDGSKFDKKSSEGTKPKKAFRSILPPGVNGKAFSNDSKEAEKQFASTIGKESFNKLKVEIEKESKSIITEKAEVLNGGFVDTNNIFYIQPPKDAPLDPNTGMPLLPSTFGGFNPETGIYENKFFTLTSDGQFVPRNELQDGRAPASEAEKLLPPPSIMNLFEGEGAGEFEDFDGPEDFDIDPSDLIDELAEDRDQVIDDLIEESQGPTTKARLIFNVN